MSKCWKLCFTLFNLFMVGGFATIVACKPPSRKWHTECDQAMQKEVFLSCLEKTPRGPERLTASGNDMDEVVDECSRASRNIACKIVEE